MSKKSTYKGVRYIAKSLTKYYGNQFPSYKDALPRAREVMSQLSSSGQKVTLKNIGPLVKKGRKPKKGAPELDPALLRPSDYFELQNYPALIARVSKEVWFTSRLIPTEAGEIQGGTVPDYKTFFAPYVNFINGIAAKYDREESRYNTEWKVKCTEPVFNRTKKRWESKIISIDVDEDEFDYGFNPKKPYQEAPESPKLSKPEAEPKTPQTEEKVPSTPSAQQEEKVIQAQTEKIKAETEQKRQDNISMAMDLLKSGQITKDEFKELMAQIKR